MGWEWCGWVWWGGVGWSTPSHHNPRRRKQLEDCGAKVLTTPPHPTLHPAPTVQPTSTHYTPPTSPSHPTPPQYRQKRRIVHETRIAANMQSTIMTDPYRPVCQDEADDSCESQRIPTWNNTKPITPGPHPPPPPPQVQPTPPYSSVCLSCIGVAAIHHSEPKR